MNPVTPENYVDHAMRTDTPITEELIMRLTDPDFIRLLHAGMGLCTESGEFMDMLKRHLFYGKPLDYVNAREELGDMAWYTALAIDVIRTSIHEVMTVNINKLKLRYPEKFSEVNAIERDLVAERELLEANPYLRDCERPEFIAGELNTEINENVENLFLNEPISKRGSDWINFSNEVLTHIKNYTINQYGDAGEDQVTKYSPNDCIKQVEKYTARFGRNARIGEQNRDLLKAAHYTQLTYTKLQEGTL